MDFEARKKTAREMVAKFLDDFSPPRGIEDDKLRSRITFIAEAFARRMPTNGNFPEQVEAVMMKLRDTHESNTWPAQAAFIMAMPSGEQRAFAKLESFQSNDAERYSRLMNAGEAIPETAIWGNITASLDVPREVLASYRKGSAARWQTIYKQDAHKLMRSQYGAAVDEYFRTPVQ